MFFFQMAEEIMEDEQKKFGMTKDGSLVVDEENDYAIQFLKNIDWNRPLKKNHQQYPFHQQRRIFQHHGYEIHEL